MSHVSDQDLHALLKTHFGYDAFRYPQLEVIRSIISGRDTFALMPTGAGKSLCFQLPALALSGLTIVISPLIALMKDQVDHMRDQGIAAECVNSTMTVEQLRQVALDVNAGKVKLLYLSPERLAVPRFQEWLCKKDVSLIAIDEAHCISEWGHDFRPHYRELTHLRRLFPDTPIIALTATAVPQVRKDILTLLQLHKPQTFQTSFNRPNLHYVIRNNVDRWPELLGWLKKYTGESVVIYCLTRKKTEQVAADLIDEGFSAAAYHAGLPKEKRTKIQDDFLKDRVQIVVATIAFGMGIDKPNIRLVVHYDLPKSLEGYYQETGRAGRDGILSHCVLFFDKSSPGMHWRFIMRMQDPKAKKMASKKFDQMLQFCQTDRCRRKSVLEYFAEKYSETNCASCDHCVEEYKLSVTPTLARQELSYNQEVFEKLKQLRLRLADIESVPAFVIFGDQSLREMATYLPRSEDEFGKITGVGKFKLEKYGKVFTKLISQLCEKDDLEPTFKPKKRRVQMISEFRAESTYQETAELLKQGKTLDEIAAKRRVKLSTIFTHLEQISQSSADLDIEHLRPNEQDFISMKKGFEKVGLDRLAPVKEVLNHMYDYDQLRLVRVFLRMEQELEK